MAKEIKRLIKKQKSSSDDRMIPYADFTINKSPIFEKTVLTLNFEQLLEEALKTGKEIKPVRYRLDFSFERVCPFCGAPNEYIYDNNGRGQYKCKLCKNIFTVKTTASDEAGIYCPCCAVSFLNTMTAKAMLSMFVLVKNVPIARRKRSFTRKTVMKSLKLQANSIDFVIITVI